MTYCSNCGSIIEGDNLFCPKCGLKVYRASKANKSAERTEQISGNIKSITNQINFTKIINILKTSVLNPVSGGKQFVAKTEKTNFIIITIILTFLQGILGIWRINQIVSSLQTIATNFLQNISILVRLFQQSSSYNVSYSDLESLNKTITQFKYSIAIPYGKVFIDNCGLYLIYFFVSFILIYLGTSIFGKVKCTPFIVFKTILTSTLPFLTCEIISILLSYFSAFLGIGLIILGALISITTLAIIVRESLQIKENLCVLIVSISSVIALATFFIVFTFDLSNISKIIMNSYNSSLFKY